MHHLYCQVDPYIISIEAHSGQVALYKFNGGKGDWEKTEVEGTLFVYQREADPQVHIIITAPVMFVQRTENNCVPSFSTASPS